MTKLIFFILKYGWRRYNTALIISEAHSKQRRMKALVTGACRLQHEIPGASMPIVSIPADYIPHLPHYSKYQGKILIQKMK